MKLALRATNLMLDGIKFRCDSLPGMTILEPCLRPGDRLVPSRRRSRSRSYNFVNAVADADGRSSVLVMHNAGEPGCLIEALGPEAAWYWSQVRAAFPGIGLRVTRRDEAIDLPEDGSFKAMRPVITFIKSKHQLFGELRGDDDHPELGRTLYLGRLGKDPVVARLYERGKHPDYEHLLRNRHLTRLELEVNPIGAVAQARAASWQLGHMWGARAWSQELLEIVTGSVVERVTIQPGGRSTTDDRTLWNVSKLYGSSFERLAAKLGGWPDFGLHLGALIAERRRLRADEGQEGRNV